MCLSPLWRFPYRIDNEIKWCSSPPAHFNRDRPYFIRADDFDTSGEIISAVQVPCGRCSECLISHRLQWVLRLMQERKKWRDSMFLTLTYDPEHLPEDGVRRSDLQFFMKRFRKFCGVPVKVFYCGEYGSTTARAHYHAVIFGYCFSDLVPFRKDKKGFLMFTSKKLKDLWKNGFSSVCEVNECCLSYITKDMQKLLPLQGNRNPPFIGMSKGLGDPDSADFETDKVYFEGKAYPIPRYYNKKASILDQKRHYINLQKYHNQTPNDKDLLLRIEKNENFFRNFLKPIDD